MPQPKAIKRPSNELKNKPARLRIRSDSEINRLSGIGLEKENEAAINMKTGATITKGEITKKMKVADPIDEIEKTKQVPIVDNNKKELVDPAIDYMVEPKVKDIHYWRKLAEDCQAALAKTLAENEELSFENDLLKAENAELLKTVEHAVAQEAIKP